jgi:hypothetical protein
MLAQLRLDWRGSDIGVPALPYALIHELPRGRYELAQKRLTNAENWGPTKNRTNGDIRISMRFFSRVHNTL